MSVGPRTGGRSFAFWLRIAAVVLGLAVIGAGIGWWKLTGWAPSSDTYPMQGVAISSEQGAIDWRAVRAQGADFAYIRATDSKGHRDPAFAANWAGARQAGLRYGAELVYDLCEHASTQATLFITTVPRDNAALPPAIRLDVDGTCRPTADSVLSELNTLINLIEAHSGMPALLHPSAAFEETYGISKGINRTLWLDGNFFTPDYASRPWVLWTATDVHRIDGVSGPVKWAVIAP